MMTRLIRNEWAKFFVASIMVTFAQPASGQDYTDFSSCADGDCHAELTADFETNPHIVLDAKGIALRTGAEFSCAACHGDVTEHVDDDGGGDIFAFGADVDPMIVRQKCQTCHAADHPQFAATGHAASDLSCASCHSMHTPHEGGSSKAALLSRPVNESCKQCHADVAEHFSLSESHQLGESGLNCASCHDPHAPLPSAMLGSFGDQACAKCHVDKSGPFAFEHGSMLVEGCTSCHTPHGSTNRHMLKIQRVDDLCLSCHATLPVFHLQYRDKGTNCVACHSSIHGSNISPQFLR